jgi:iron complex transport system substrate-binding protein
MRIATLNEMLEEVVHLGEATGTEAEAHELRGELEGRLAAVRAAVSGANRPRVVALERLDPPHAGGFWIPEMISIAGGDDVAGSPGLSPPSVGWGELAGLSPDVVVVAMAGGTGVEDARAQAMEHWERIDELGAGCVFIVETTPALTKAGPRLVDGVELLGHLIHPDLVDAPGNIAFAQISADGTKTST